MKTKNQATNNSKGNQATTAEIKPATTSVNKTLTTKHIAPLFKMTPQALRRVLRSMPEYADGKHTNYRWAENDAAIKRIEAAIAKRKAEDKDKADKAKAQLAPASAPAKA